jgi:hypothetical protein
MTVIKLFSTLLLGVFSLTAIAQTKPKPNAGNTAAVNKQFKQKDTSYWVDNFRQFRDALYQADKPKAKVFFDFPFNNETNEIWYLAYAGNDEAIDKLSATVKPLTEKDFDKYFSKIFSPELIKCLLPIKTDELYKKGESESPELKSGSTTYKLYVTYTKADSTIELNLATKTSYKISATEYETSESNYIYYFQVLPNGHVKFKKLLIAG